MKREIDTKALVEFVRKYGPIHFTGVRDLSGKCDFCGNPNSQSLVELEALHVHKSVWVCASCDSLETLVGKAAANEIRFNSCLEPDVLLSNQSLKEAETVANLLGNTFNIPVFSEESKLVQDAKINLAFGLGITWKHVPGILQIWDRVKKLTYLQVETLERYNEFCKKEDHERRTTSVDSGS